MPCLGDPWHYDLTPGTPEFTIAERKVQDQLERLIHIVNYYCKAYCRDFPANFPGNREFELLHEDDKQLLAAIHHHLRCDGIKADATMDIWCLTRMYPEKYIDEGEIAKDCHRLSRMGSLLRDLMRQNRARSC